MKISINSATKAKVLAKTMDAGREVKKDQREMPEKGSHRKKRGATQIRLINHTRSHTESG